jgi:hypothetical protein
MMVSLLTVAVLALAGRIRGAAPAARPDRLGRRVPDLGTVA